MSVLRVTIARRCWRSTWCSGYWPLTARPRLIGPLVVPLVLAALVAMGVSLQRFMGITPRKPHFRDREDDSAS